MDTPLRPSASARKLPRTLVALIALWVLAHLYTFLVTRDPVPVWPEMPQPFEIKIADVLRFLNGLLMIALIGYGLVRRLRFAWVVAFLWQAIQAGLGFVLLSLNDFRAASYTHFGGMAFWGVVLPIGVAVVSFVLLLLPPTTRWIRTR